MKINVEDLKIGDIIFVRCIKLDVPFELCKVDGIRHDRWYLVEMIYDDGGWSLDLDNIKQYKVELFASTRLGVILYG